MFAEDLSFKPPGSLTTAVLFLVFNRPDVTSRVFEVITRVRPPRLYVAADGPRANRPDDVGKCNEVRSIVSKVDWPCEVKTLFQTENLGCKLAVSSAITWFFEQEEEGIVLEDDCLPNLSFFWFCQELLERYRNDTRIWQICGFNPVATANGQEEDYYFTKYGPVWGWASWRRAWSVYDKNMSCWPDVRGKELYWDFCDSKREAHWRRKLYNQVFSGEIDTWDYQWGFYKFINSGLCISPTRNLIANIGFGENATHAKKEVFYRSMECTWPLRHPTYVMRSLEKERQYFKLFALPVSWRSRIRALLPK
ncbi:MAG: glycosyltransferase family 2 protein [Nitrospiraceae bacterium]|nr:MAG: glycosyltransferase family 2 protein [Nitrospiraceae bacterium]